MISIDHILYENSNQCQMIRVSWRLTQKDLTVLTSLHGVQGIVCNVRFQFDGVSLYLGKLFTG